MKKITLGVIGAVLLSGPLLADGLDLRTVPAEARRLIHLDVSALVQSSLWGFVEQAMEHDDREELAELEREFGINPFVDLRSITIYDTGGDLEEVAAVIRATSGVDQALERLRQEDGYRSVRADDLVVHSWGEGDESVYAFVRETSRDERLVLLSNRKRMLMDGIRVQLGQAPSLADSRDPGITARPSANAFFFLAATQGLPGMDWSEEASNIMGLAEELVLEVGEARGLLFARATISAETLEDARNLVDVLNGVRALARLALGMEEADEVPPVIMDVLDSLEFHHRDREVHILIEIDLDDLVQELGLEEQSH